MSGRTIDTRSPYTYTEWEEVSRQLKRERERRRFRKLLNDDGIVLFSQAEQADLVRQVVEDLRSR